MDEILHITTEEIQKDGMDTFHHHRYEPTPYDVLEALFARLPLTAEDVLVDYGCGLGRVNFYAEYLFHCKSVGVEFAREYYERAEKNLTTYIGQAKHVTFVCGAAEEYFVAADETFFYFFNPFSDAIFRRVVNRILDSYYRVPRRLTIVLYYPEDDAIFYLDRHTDFRCVDEFSPCVESSDRRERFSIWRMEA